MITYTQHSSASGLLCTPATGDHDHLTEDDTSQTSVPIGMHDLSQTNSFIAGEWKKHELARRTDRQLLLGLSWHFKCHE